MRIHMRSVIVASVAVAGLSVQALGGGVPVSGMPVPELASFDTIMTDYMADYDIGAGLLAVMKDGVIVYQRGFGWKDAGQTVQLRHDAPVRIASITKPFTAAAVQRLIATNHLENDDFVFNINGNGGILDLTPFGTADANLDDVQVQHVYSHISGLPTNDGNDPMFREIEIADDMGLPSPPGATPTARWTMGQPLQSVPGNSYAYSNVGFMILGLVVAEASGMTHLDYVKQSVIGPVEWCPTSELVLSRTFPGDRDPREPHYDSNGVTRTNVYDPDGDPVPAADGGYHHELHFASGGLASSTTVLLHLAETYYINGENASNGQSTTYGLPTNGVRQTRSHGGLLWGSSCRLKQRSDGINIAVWFNKWGTDDNGALYGNGMMTAIEDEIDNNIAVWPTQGVDGQWMDFANAGAGDGSYEDGWSDVSTALAEAADEATVNIKSGSSNWTGVINQKVRIRAPEGTVRIGG